MAIISDMGADLKLSAFLTRAWFGMLPTMSPQQKQLLPFPPPPSGTTRVNDRVLFRTEGTRRVISVHGVIFAHYDVRDRAAGAYAMAALYESGYADQNDLARSFGCSARSVRRYQQRLETGGLARPLLGGAQCRRQPTPNRGRWGDKARKRWHTSRIEKLVEGAAGVPLVLIICCRSSFSPGLHKSRRFPEPSFFANPPAETGTCRNVNYDRLG